MGMINMRITTEKRAATYRVLVKDEKSNATCSFPIYLEDHEQVTKEEILSELKKCINSQDKKVCHKVNK